ncbi:MAG: amidohydrolase [Clostridium sp.]
MNQNKLKIIETIDGMQNELLTLSHQIHDHPEVGFQEHQAVRFISSFLEKHGFEVETPYCGLDTSFKVVKKGKGSGPRISFLAEYDALRGIGHGCGHNIIATCAVGAFSGLSAIMDNYNGEISIIGTPAEEGGAGKVILLERGGFDETDYALMMHPSGGGSNLVGRGGRAATTIHVSFHGKSAHSSAPSNGINALSAAIHVFNQIDLMRPTFQIQDNINGVILEGGTAANVIPELARCEFNLRAETMMRIEFLIDLVKSSIERAEALTRARAEVTVEPIYAERYPNRPMCETFKNNMESLGISMSWPTPGKLYGSSDIGNVSIKLPAIHDYLSITDDKTIQSHSKAYADAAATPQADDICLKGAKGLAMTALDILESSEFRDEINAYHDAQVPKEYQGKY